MKYPTKYRYVVWDVSGYCEVVNKDPTPSKSGRGYWGIDNAQVVREPALDGQCPGEWDERVYDMEDENDRRLIEALMNL